MNIVTFSKPPNDYCFSNSDPQILFKIRIGQNQKIYAGVKYEMIGAMIVDVYRYYNKVAVVRKRDCLPFVRP